MCGIGGKIIWKSGSINHLELEKIKEKILHRGPDDSGIFLSKNKKVGLVSTRLAIIDLSVRGHQPMDFGNRYKIVFNGEIYNYSQERKRLEKKGVKFVSDTDTEVILALYAAEGVNCLSRLHGMFALAIYDTLENTLFLARDRIGKKPLKYYIDCQVFIFASELKAILTQKEVRASPDMNSVRYYLNYGYTPAPLTGFERIYKLEPAHYIFIDINKGRFEKKRYWKLNFNQKLKLSESEWSKLILSQLEEAVKIRMRADVPLGVLLSGGVDSSAITALMSGLSSRPVKTFTIRFRDKFYDEGEYALKISKLYHTEHVEMEAEVNNVEEILPDLIYKYEEPFADNSIIVTNIVSKLAKKQVTVALNGDGGDENFAGYDRHIRLLRDAGVYPFRRPIRYLGQPIIKTLVNVSGSRSLARINKYLNCIEETPLEKFIKYSSFFKNETSEFYQTKYSESGAIDIRDCALYADLVCFLPDYLLTKMDIAGMSNGLEFRSPFLDQKVIELAAKIPYDLKVKGRETKYILKKSLEKIVPMGNLYRPKMGFTIPLGKWLEGPLNSYARKILLNPRAMIRKEIKTLNAKQMFIDHSVENDYGLKLWNLLCLELWFQRFFG